MEPVVAVRRIRLIGESGFVEDRVHEFAGGIAGEGTPGAIGTVGSGSETEHEHAGVGISEAGDGLAPVFAITIGAAFLARDALAIFDEAGAKGASDDFAVEDGKPWGHEGFIVSGALLARRTSAVI